MNIRTMLKPVHRLALLTVFVLGFPVIAAGVLVSYTDLSSRVLGSDHVVLAQWENELPRPTESYVRTYRVIRVYRGNLTPGELVHVVGMQPPDQVSTKDIQPQFVFLSRQFQFGSRSTLPRGVAISRPRFRHELAYIYTPFGWFNHVPTLATVPTNSFEESERDVRRAVQRVEKLESALADPEAEAGSRRSALLNLVPPLAQPGGDLYHLWWLEGWVEDHVAIKIFRTFAYEGDMASALDVAQRVHIWLGHNFLATCRDGVFDAVFDTTLAPHYRATALTLLGIDHEFFSEKQIAELIPLLESPFVRLRKAAARTLGRELRQQALNQDHRTVDPSRPLVEAMASRWPYDTDGTVQAIILWGLHWQREREIFLTETAPPICVMSSFKAQSPQALSVQLHTSWPESPRKQAPSPIEDTDYIVAQNGRIIVREDLYLAHDRWVNKPENREHTYSYGGAVTICPLWLIKPLPPGVYQGWIECSADSGDQRWIVTSPATEFVIGPIASEK